MAASASTRIKAEDWRDVIGEYKTLVSANSASRSRKTRKSSSGARSARSSAPG